jgi:hypothetical protein
MKPPYFNNIKANGLINILAKTVPNPSITEIYGRATALTHSCYARVQTMDVFFTADYAE